MQSRVRESSPGVRYQQSVVGRTCEKIGLEPAVKKEKE